MSLTETPSRLSLRALFAPLVAPGDRIEIGFAQGRAVVRAAYSANTDAARLTAAAAETAFKVGDIVDLGAAGPWESAIYCETKSGCGFLVAPQDSGVMPWQDAQLFALRRNTELPSRRLLDAMYQSRSRGAFAGTFNQIGKYPDGWYWSGTQTASFHAWGQRFSDGFACNDSDTLRSSVRCIRKTCVI